MIHTIINAVLFQCLWFSAVMYGWQWGLVPLLLLSAHFIVSVKVWSLRLLPFAVAAFGMLFNSVLAYLGVYQFNADDLLFLDSLPLWLTFMWLGFAMTLPLSLAWLFRFRVLFVLFFALGGPASYFAGMKLGALNFDASSLLILSIEWSLLALLSLLFLRPFILPQNTQSHLADA